MRKNGERDKAVGMRKILRAAVLSPVPATPNACECGGNLRQGNYSGSRSNSAVTCALMLISPA